MDFVKAMVLDSPGGPLRLSELPDPDPAPGQVLLRVRACGVCRTDLHVLDGELEQPKLPLVLGHQIVGRDADTRRAAWSSLARLDGRRLPLLPTGRENLCERARFTGYDLDGGLRGADGRRPPLLLPDPDGYPDLEAAPLLCAGLIGYRALRLRG